MCQQQEKISKAVDSISYSERFVGVLYGGLRFFCLFFFLFVFSVRTVEN